MTYNKNTISIVPKAVDVLRFNHGIKYQQINLNYRTITKINNGEEVFRDERQNNVCFWFSYI